MRTIRHGVFETNSSSTHSISIDKSAALNDRLPITDGQVIVFPNEFGWEIEDYNDPSTKASYCLVYAMTSGSYDSESGYSTNERYLEMLRQAISEVMDGLPVVFQPNVSDWQKKADGTMADDWGYIDHQSHDTAEEAFEDVDTLKAFIFNSGSTLHTDNDNH